VTLAARGRKHRRSAGTSKLPIPAPRRPRTMGRPRKYLGSSLAIIWTLGHEERAGLDPMDDEGSEQQRHGRGEGNSYPCGNASRNLARISADPRDRKITSDMRVTN